MSPKNVLLAAGLVGLGLVGATAQQAVVDQPAPSTGAVSSAAPSAAPSVLLLSNGRIVPGTVTETDEGYLVKTPIGPLPFKRSQVERVVGSVREAYEYKAARVPENDVEEHMKLAQWCLAQKLRVEAKEQLDHVLARVPDHPLAKSMQFQLELAENQSRTKSDEAVMRTNAERIEPGAPALLGSQALRTLRDAARTNPLPAGAPVIFDLPQARAVKRYQEFGAYVHPALQRACASCHNEHSNSSFQLIRAQSRHDLDNNLLVRANLDATLRLVDPNDPPRSTLLSSAIMPHKPTGRSILTGPNDPTYRLLLQWVNLLQSPTATEAKRTGDASQAPSNDPAEGGFAAGRLPNADRTPSTLAAASKPTTTAMTPRPSQYPNAIVQPNTGEVAPVNPAPAGQLLPGSATGLPGKSPEPSEFPVSHLMGGRASVGSAKRTAQTAASSTSAPTPAGTTTAEGPASAPVASAAPKVLKRGPDGSEVWELPDGSQQLRLPNGMVVPMTKAGAASPQKGAADSSAGTALKSNIQINPDALQQFMSGGKQ